MDVKDIIVIIGEIKTAYMISPTRYFAEIHA